MLTDEELDAIEARVQSDGIVGYETAFALLAEVRELREQKNTLLVLNESAERGWAAANGEMRELRGLLREAGDALAEAEKRLGYRFRHNVQARIRAALPDNTEGP